MKRCIMSLIFLLALSCVVFASSGCGKPQSAGDQPTTYGTARAIDDGAPKYFEAQMACPVCGRQGLVAEYHVDVDGKRVYFDRKECVEKFTQNQSEYVEKLDKTRQKIKQMRGQ